MVFLIYLIARIFMISLVALIALNFPDVIDCPNGPACPGYPDYPGCPDCLDCIYCPECHGFPDGTLSSALIVTYWHLLAVFSASPNFPNFPNCWIASFFWGCDVVAMLLLFSCYSVAT